jgi:NAD(P)-dependent dehydrogenase (short-subunit alcohol dehydrogenase family)
VLLQGKNAVIYGGGGSIGGAVARAFAREGAKVHLAGRTRATLEEVAESIRTSGGAAETAEVDALDEEAVDAHADAVAAEAGGIDISFNLIAHPYSHGTPLVEMAVDDFMASVATAARTTFLTVRAAARHMIPRRSGLSSLLAVPVTAADRCVTTTWAARRLPSTQSRPCAGSSPSSWEGTESGSSPWRAEASPSRFPKASRAERGSSR